MNEALQMGVSGYLTKPVTVEKLQTALGLPTGTMEVGTTQ